jgi:hypothetical protein
MRREAIYGEEEAITIALPKNKNLQNAYVLGGSPPGPPVTRSSAKSSGRGIGVGGGGGIGAGQGSATKPGRGGNIGGGMNSGSGGAGGVATASARPSGTLQSPTTGSLEAMLAADSRSFTQSPEETRRQQLRAKGDSVIVALIERLKKRDPIPTPAELRFVSDDKAEIQVWLVDKSAKTLAELKALGLEVIHDSKASTLVIGRIPINKLEALLDLKSVRFVAPLMRN